MVCVQLDVLPAQSVAVQVRVRVLLQSGPLELSLKNTVSGAWQWSWAVTVGAGVIWLTHSRLNEGFTGQLINCGGVVSSVVLYSTVAVLPQLSVPVTKTVAGHSPMVPVARVTA